MIALEEYLNDPCGTLSIPYWKWIRMTIPETMRILHSRDCAPAERAWAEAYFRLFHDLRNIGSTHLEGVRICAAGEEDIPAIERIINASYPDIRVTQAQIRGWKDTPVYAPDLWLMAFIGEKPVGCTVADLDVQAGEGILEWVQVLPEYRRCGIASALVNQVLRILAGRARFATVSGRCGNLSKPEMLYRNCGFTGKDVWYIVNKT